ncbi:MAG: transglutaminase domain-containing protein [bacterium]|nr:transglutaminase domain-containing protein [bacterium]
MIKKFSRQSFIVLFLAGICPALVHAFDSSAMTVPVIDFSQNIYTEKQSTFILSSKESIFSLPRTPFQKVAAKYKQGSKKIIELRTGYAARSGRNPRPAARYIANTRYLNIASPEIRKAARKLKKSKQPLAAIEQFVYGHISNKLTGIPLLPAKNIYKNRSGDCTEHSVLAIALLRSLRIPSRAVVGMILVKNFNGYRNVFVYHMWVEAYYKRKWHLLDPSNPGKKHRNRYIAFAYHSLQTATPLSYLKAISSIRNFEVRYIKK